MSEIITLTEAAQQIETDPVTLSGLVKLLQIQPKPVPRNGNAKGLDRSDMKRIRRAIKAGQSPAASPR